MNEDYSPGPAVRSVDSVLADLNKQYAKPTANRKMPASAESAKTIASAASTYCVFRGKMKRHETAQVGKLRSNTVTFYASDGTAMDTISSTPGLKAIADCTYASLHAAHAAAR